MVIVIVFLVIAALAFGTVVLMDQRAKRRRRALDRDDLPITDQLVENRRAAQVANSIYGMIDGRPKGSKPD